MTSTTGQIDATVEVVTPENIAFQYTVAGPFRRFPAFVLDLFIRVGLFLAMAFALSLAAGLAGLPNLAAGGVLILWFVLDWFYGGVLETWLNGQTPGKWIAGIRVLSVNGQPINGIQAVIRNFLRSVDMFPLVSIETFGIDAPIYFPTFTLALLTMTLNGKFQRLGDIAAGTIVVVEERRWLTGVASMEDLRIPQLANDIPVDFPISRTLARTLSTYVERRRFFTGPRRREIARHVAEPLIERFGLPGDTEYDLLLCALYYRAFIADRGGNEAQESPFEGELIG
jgi:uncharacterized RDD family membrane protein YckC